MTSEGETIPEAPAAAERAKTQPRCDVCHKSFRTHFSLNVHRKRKCGQVRPAAAEPAEGATYTCSVCKGAYPGADALLQHLQSHLSVVDSEGAAPALARTECGQECASPEDLAEHAWAHGERAGEDHVEDAVDDQTDEDADDDQTDEDAVDERTDEDAVDDRTEEHSMDCGDSDSSADGDGDEDSVNGDSAVDEPPQPPPRPQDAEAGAGPQGAGFSCRHCDRVFDLKRTCRRHELCHFKGCYPCRGCGKTFDTKTGLAVHHNFCSRGGCARTLPLVKVKPTGPKPTVPKPAVLKPTVPKPAVPKPAVPKPAVPKPAVPKPAVSKPTEKRSTSRCPICSKAFTYEACLRTHQLKCTPKAPRPRPPPKLSGQPRPPPQPKSSGQPKLPLQPRQTNSAENRQAKAPASKSCKLCRRDAQSFPKTDSTPRWHCPHRASMHKPRPYHCTFCPWSFQCVNHLKDHLMLHLGVKPFECSVCKKKFTKKRMCRLHELTHQRGLTE